MSSRTFTVSPPDNLDAQLGFLARSIIVDNPTPCFWYCAGANVWILPYTFGAIIVLPSADETAKLTFAAPIGQVQPRPAAGSVTALSVTYYETVAGPASPGVNVPISQGRAPLSLTFAVTGTTQTFLVSSPILDGFTCRVESTGALSALTLAFSWTLPGGSPRSETYYATLGTATPIEFDIPGSFPPGTTFAVTATYAVAQTVIVWII